MACKPHCECKCGMTSCECWDGILITKMLRETPVTGPLIPDAEKIED